MKYLLLIYTPESTEQAPPEVMKSVMDAYNTFTEHVKSSGAYVSAEALQPTTTATTVRVRGGEILTTDGPFAETKEALGGFYLVEAKDLDEAIGYAARIPGALEGSIEVRPIWEIPAEYDPSAAAAAATN